MRKLFSVLLLSFICCNLFAQDTLNIESLVKKSRRSYSRIVASYQQQVQNVNSNFINQLQNISPAYNGNITGNANTAILPYLYRVAGPATYYSSAVTNQLAIDYTLPSLRTDLHDLSDGMDLRGYLNERIDATLVNLYSSSPSSVRYYDNQYQNEQLVTQAREADEHKNNELTPIVENVSQVQSVTEVMDDVDFDLQVTRPNFWKTSGKFSLQFTQNYFSENWYKGGNNNLTMLSNLVLEANYNDQKKVQWDNKLDLRLGFVTVPSDTCHKFLTNNDKIYMFSKLGIKALKYWYYTVSAEANSQFLPGYKSNDRKRYSQFLAPLDVYVSLGMDYKPTLKNGNTLSVAVLPFSYKLRYIGADDDLMTIHKSYNIVDTDTKKDYGSKIELNSKITIVKNLTWKCRFYYFTSYKYVESELENSLQFAFNKYISSEIYTLWRFDDSRSRQYYDKSLGYFQFKEYFTLGLAYSF